MNIVFDERIAKFIGLLDGIWAQTLVRLLLVPRTIGP